MTERILCGDSLEMLRTLPDKSVHCCVTSPPYLGLRDYGVQGQIGLEKTPEEYVAKMVEIFREVRRVLRKDGTCWVNLGDSFWNGGAEKRDGGHGFVDGGKLKLDKAKGSLLQAKSSTNLALKPKDIVGIPWRVAFALQADGWWLRQDIIWHKPNPMPESVTDRCTKAHEFIFLLTKSARYFYDAEAVKELAKTNPHNSGYVNGNQYAVGPMNRGGHSQREDPKRVWAKDGLRNHRSVWAIATQPYPEAHFATFPEAIPETCILAGCPQGGVVLDPFAGSGTVGAVAKRLGHDSILIELNPEYIKLIEARLKNVEAPGLFAKEACVCQ